MAIVFTELVKKGTDSGSTGGDDKYLNMVKMMMCQHSYDDNNGLVLLPYKLDITKDYFDSNIDTALLCFPENPYLTSIETPESIRHIGMMLDNCENLKTVSLLGYGCADAHGNAEPLRGTTFYGCVNLTTLNLPKFEGDLEYSFVSGNIGSNNLEKIIIPNVYRITSGFFAGCNNLKLVDFRGRLTSNIPELGSASDFCQDSSVNCTMVIPDNLYDTWTHSGAWYTLYSSSNYHFVKESEYTE